MGIREEEVLEGSQFVLLRRSTRDQVKSGAELIMTAMVRDRFLVSITVSSIFVLPFQMLKTPDFTVSSSQPERQGHDSISPYHFNCSSILLPSQLLGWTNVFPLYLHTHLPLLDHADKKFQRYKRPRNLLQAFTTPVYRVGIHALYPAGMLEKNGDKSAGQTRPNKS
jgi:hypothetical protein